MTTNSIEQLTPRERSVLELVARGLSNDGIGEALTISSKTVEGTLRSVFLKLGLGYAAPTENRRVKAALCFLDATGERDAAGARLSRDLRDLMATAPFDSLASMLERRSVEAGEQSWVLRATAAWYATIHEDLPQAGRLARRAVEMASKSELGRVITRGMTSVLDAFQGLAPINHDRLDEMMSAMLAQSDQTGERAHLCANLEVPNWLTFADRFADADALTARFIEHESLDIREQIGLLCCQVEADLRRGRWDQAESSLVEVLKMSGLSGIASGYADSLGARVQALRGDSVASRAHLVRSRATGIDRGDRSTLWRADAAECSLLLGCGQHRAAAALADALHAARTDGGLCLPSVRGWDLDAIEALHRCGRPDMARTLVNALASDVDLTQSRSGGAVLCATRGLLAGSDGLDDLQRAASEFRAMGTPFELARVQLMIAEATVEAAPLIASDAAQSALTLFEALRSEHWSATARALLARLDND